jgi:hypothetical protein
MLLPYRFGIATTLCLPIDIRSATATEHSYKSNITAMRLHKRYNQLFF